MDASSSGSEASQMAKQAMGKASSMYEDAVSQAGPGMAANASFLLVLLVAVASLLTFIDNPGSSSFVKVPFKSRFYDSFAPGTLGIIGLLVIATVLIGRTVTGDIKPMSKKQVLSLSGAVGAIMGIVMVVSTIIGASLDRTGQTKISLVLVDAGWTVLVLAASLWASAEARKL